MLRERYELATILRGKMTCLFYAFLLSGFAMLFLVFALGFVGVGKAPSITQIVGRISHAIVPKNLGRSRSHQAGKRHEQIRNSEKLVQVVRAVLHNLLLAAVPGTRLQGLA